MQNTDTAIEQSLAFFQSGMGLAMLSLIALLALACVLLTVLVVSLGATQRTLVARSESANLLLAQIRESLAGVENPLPRRYRPVLNEPNLPPRRVADVEVDAPRVAEKASPSRRAARSASSAARTESPQRRRSAEATGRPARSARSDGKTDVYVSTDSGNAGVRPATGARADARTDLYKSADEERAGTKRGSRAGSSTDVFKSVDI